MKPLLALLTWLPEPFKTIAQLSLGVLITVLLMALRAHGQQTQPPVTLAQHGAPYSSTNFIPYEVRFMKADFYLTAGHFYTLQFSDAVADPNRWQTIATYAAPTDDVWTPGVAYYVNGMFYPLGFFRMVEE